MGQTFSLNSAELAVLMDHMTGGRLLDETAALTELQVDQEALVAAEENLLDRGLLLSLPFEQVPGVTSQLASVLSAALSPDRVCVVRTIHQDHSDPPVIFSFTSESITRNQVDQHGQHVFTELADQDEALTAILSTGGALDAHKRRGTAQPRPVEQLLKDAQRLIMLMVVVDPAGPGAAAHSLAWVETDAGLWLVDGASGGDTPVATPVAIADLRDRIGSILEGSVS
jgi:hypothetical protein